MPLVSNLPPATVARAPQPPGQTHGAVLVARHAGYLAVQILFHGRPVPGLEVTFRTAEDGAGPALGPPLLSDDEGVARLDRVVPAGVYVCEIEHQEPAEVSTVPAVDEAFVIVLPVGRPYVDVLERPEHLRLSSSDATPPGHEPGTPE